MLSRFHPFALFAAMLALVSQLALGATVLPDTPDPLAALDAAMILCGVPAPTPAPAQHQAPDRALVPLSAALALPAVMLAAPPMIPRASAMLAFRASLPPPARAPPGHAVLSAYPRGPPVLA